MKIEIRDDRPPVPPERLAAAERALEELDRRIPPSYKAFLAEQDGGKPVRNSFTFRQDDEDQSDFIRLFYGIAESPNGDLVSRATSASTSLPEGLLPIATDSFGNLVVLDGRDGGDGPVYFWDHERQTEPPDDSALSWLAPDLETFLGALTEAGAVAGRDRADARRPDRLARARARAAAGAGAAGHPAPLRRHVGRDRPRPGSRARPRARGGERAAAAARRRRPPLDGLRAARRLATQPGGARGRRRDLARAARGRARRAGADVEHRGGRELLALLDEARREGRPAAP